MTTAFAVILTLYLLLLLGLLFGWVRIRRQTMPTRTTDPPSISIIVAVRNEATTIGSLLGEFSAMAFPKDRFEVILVDDHSTDLTVEVIRAAISAFPQARLLQLPGDKSGKKAALRMGIDSARFDIIATTDADCTVSKNWLTCIASYFQSADNKLVVGPVKFHEDPSFFGRLQVMEFVSVAGTTAATIGLGHPVMCNGANLAFRKETFYEVGGYDDNLAIASGDDEFLLRKVFRRYPHGIRYLNYYEAVVTTKVQPTLHDFMHQRLRWAGKWRYNQDGVARTMAVFVLLAQASFLGLIVLSALHPGLTPGLIILKIFLEGVFIAWVARFLERRFYWPAFVVLQLAYPFYILLVGMLSLLLPHRWKGRNYAQG